MENDSAKGFLVEIYENGLLIVAMKDVISTIEVPWDFFDNLPEGMELRIDGEVADSKTLLHKLQEYKKQRDRMPPAPKHKSGMYSEF